MMIAISLPSHPPMPQTARTKSHEQMKPAKMATSVAILPSSPICSPSSLNPNRYPSHPSYTPPSRRPKLQLNTSNIRSFGRGSSLRLDTLSAVSPTARNTFSNAYEGAPASAAPVLYNPLKIQTPSESVEMAKLSDRDDVEGEDMDSPHSASTQSSISSEQTLSTERADPAQAYKINHNIPSILSNSPLKHLRKRKVASSRPMFPAVKKVTFRSPLEEEIITAKYTWAHSDIEEPVASIETSTPPPESDSSSGSTISIHSDSSTSSTRSPTPDLSDQAVSPTSSTSSTDSLTRQPRIGEKRDSSSSDSDNDSCPETPVAGRRKRRREWVWTLGSPR